MEDVDGEAQVEESPRRLISLNDHRMNFAK
jgi:hypothetical protein